jgi:hypothetical protein
MVSTIDPRLVSESEVCKRSPRPELHATAITVANLRLSSRARIMKLSASVPALAKASRAGEPEL